MEISDENFTEYLYGCLQTDGTFYSENGPSQPPTLSSLNELAAQGWWVHSLITQGPDHNPYVLLQRGVRTDGK